MTVTATTAAKLVQTNTRPLAFQAKYCRSRSVGGVDFDVLRREIGGPHRRCGRAEPQIDRERSEEHTSELQSPCNLVCRLLLEKKKKTRTKGVYCEILKEYQ